MGIVILNKKPENQHSYVDGFISLPAGGPLAG